MINVILVLVRPSTGTILSDIRLPEILVNAAQLAPFQEKAINNLNCWVHNNYFGFVILNMQFIILPNNGLQE